MIEQCHHCGGLADRGALNVGAALRVRKRPEHWVCPRCFQIEAPFLAQETDLPKLKGLTAANCGQFLEGVYRRTDAFVQQELKRQPPAA